MPDFADLFALCELEFASFFFQDIHVVDILTLFQCTRIQSFVIVIPLLGY